MKKTVVWFMGIFFWCVGGVQASNITILDQNYSAGSGWYGFQEDQEVEPGMATNQSWDLEGFFLNGQMLSLVGGYDFIKGNSGYASGDIFIDINGDAVFGDVHGPQETDGNHAVVNSYGYDFVVDLDWTCMTYDVYQINNHSMVETAYYVQNQGSSPWRYLSGGTSVSRGKTLGYHETASGYDAIFAGGTGSHKELIVDLGFLPEGIEFIAHYTMGCGNDNIMGRGTIPNPEPSTALLLGAGLMGMAGLSRKKG